MWQAESETYVSDDCDLWRCPIINEWDREYSRCTMRIHGVDVEVHSHVSGNPGRYLSRDDGYTYTIDDDETREEFFRYHDIEEEETEDED